MIKKLTLTAIVVFLALGALFPHSVKASPAVGNSPGGVSFVDVIKPDTYQALYKCKTSDLGGGVGVAASGVSKIISFGSDKDYVGQIMGMCDSTGKSDPAAFTQEDVTAYFQQSGNAQGGVNSILSNLNAQLLNQRPASGVDYIGQQVYAITNPGKVYAAENPSTYYPGPGSELLRPIQGFWGWSVNLVFGFLVLLILVVALAIMFRQRLGGAAEVTIQSAIPSIALAMILIPLSYAISGLFIDAITLGTNAIHGFLLGPQSPGSAVYANRPNATAEECDLQNTDVIGGTTCDRGYYADDPLIDVWRARDRIDLRQTGAQVGAGIATAVPSAQGIFNFIGGILKLLPGDEDQFSEFAWFGNVINIIIGILTIWVALQIFKRLIGKYLTLIIMPAFSPFIFATAALPGNGTKSIITYLKTMGSAALFYIVTYAMFILTLIFTDPTFQASLPDFRTGGYIPPLLGLQSIIKSLTTTANAFPLTQLLMTLVGLGIYFSIPKTLDGIDEALGTKFVLPQFIKTPFESMQESYKFATRVAPSAAATAVKTTAAGVRNITSGVVSARYRAQVALQNARGINPDLPGGATYEKRQQFLAKRQDIMAQLASERSIPKRAALEAQLQALNGTESLFTINTQAEGDKKQTMSVKITFFSEASSIKYAFSNADILDIYKKAAGKSTYDIAIGKLQLVAENFQFTAPVNVLAGYVVPIGGTSDSEFGDPLENGKTPKGLVVSDEEIFGMPSAGSLNTASPVKPVKGKELDFFVNGAKAIQNPPISVFTLSPFKNPEKNNSAVSTTLIMRVYSRTGSTMISALDELFGNGTTFTGGLLSGSTTIVTPERAFRYKNFETEPFKITIGSAGR